MIELKILFMIFTLVSGQKANYDNFKVYRILPTSVEENLVLHRISHLSDGYSFWIEPSVVNASSDLMVAPEKLLEFQGLMNITGIKYVTYIENVQELIENENPKRKRENKIVNDEFDWTSYHTLEEIYDWLDSLVDIHPKKVQVVVGGWTYEGREIKGVKLSLRDGNPGIFLEGNIHGREWITSATVTYIINQLLTSQNPEIRNLAEKNDWYIFPIFNPDGFVYSHKKLRLWRKTRKPYDLLCIGADPNRNWNYEWNQGGTTSSPCSERFAGSEPFSDVETRTMSQYIKSISGKFYAYLAFHSYGQHLLFPYGHAEKHVENQDELVAIGLKTIDAISKRYGTKYKMGKITKRFGLASGSSIDWVKAEVKPTIAYAYELRDRGKGRKGGFGFLLPANQIIPTGEETLDSFVAMFREAEERGIPRRN